MSGDRHGQVSDTLGFTMTYDQLKESRNPTSSPYGSVLAPQASGRPSASVPSVQYGQLPERKQTVEAKVREFQENPWYKIPNQVMAAEKITPEQYLQNNSNAPVVLRMSSSKNNTGVIHWRYRNDQLKQTQITITGSGYQYLNENNKLTFAPTVEELINYFKPKQTPA